MRKAFATIGGIAVAILVIVGVESLTNWLYPVSLDSDDAEALALLIANLPFTAKLLIVFGWFAAPFVGGWLALRVSDWRPAGWIVAGVVAAAGIANVIQLPHPLWMDAAAVLAPLAGGWLAQRLHVRPYPGEPLIG